MTTEFVKNLWMLQETLNAFLEAGCSEVRRKDMRLWIDPLSGDTQEALNEWQSKGFVTIVSDLRQSKDKDVCLRIHKRIEALPMPEDLNE